MNRVLAHTGVTYPIVQAPMGWIARSQQAAAVASAGGLGVIETSSGEMEASLALAGQLVGLIQEVLPVAKIIGRTVDGFHEIQRAHGGCILSGIK